MRKLKHGRGTKQRRNFMQFLSIRPAIQVRENARPEESIRLEIKIFSRKIAHRTLACNRRIPAQSENVVEKTSDSATTMCARIAHFFNLLTADVSAVGDPFIYLEREFKSSTTLKSHIRAATFGITSFLRSGVNLAR